MWILTYVIASNQIFCIRHARTETVRTVQLYKIFMYRTIQTRTRAGIKLSLNLVHPCYLFIRSFHGADSFLRSRKFLSVVPGTRRRNVFPHLKGGTHWEFPRRTLRRIFGHKREWQKEWRKGITKSFMICVLPAKWQAHYGNYIEDQTSHVARKVGKKIGRQELRGSSCKI
jgi:hypothetical protein